MGTLLYWVRTVANFEIYLVCTCVCVCVCVCAHLYFALVIRILQYLIRKRISYQFIHTHDLTAIFYLSLYQSISTYDLNNIRLSGALYVRKVAQAIDPNMYIILPVDRPEQIPPISWPSDVKIGPVPDWEKTVAQLRKKAAEKDS